MKKILKAIIIVAITILLEITLFNFRYWEVEFSGLEEKQIKVEDENIVSDQYNGNINLKKIKIEPKEKVKGVKYNIKTNSKYNVIVQTSFRDNSEKYQDKLLEDNIYNIKNKYSDYIVLNSMQECNEINISILATEEVSIEDITLNTWYFNFNIYRVIIIALIGIYIINISAINNFFKKNSKLKNVVYILIIQSIFLGYISYAIPYAKYIDSTEEDAKVDIRVIRDQYELLTKALVKGKISLDLDEDSKKQLLELDDYRDYSEKLEKNVKFYNDVAFYNGNYYCYYGIVPVIMVSLPIALLFNIYIKSNFICIVFTFTFMVLITLIYKKLLKKFDIKLKFTTEIIGFLAFLLSTGIYNLMATGMVYQAVNLCANSLGLFIIYLFLLLEDKNKTKLKICLIGLSFALMVCTRPIYVLYIIPIVYLLKNYFVENKKIKIKNMVLFSVPIIILALAQMYYNYIRFESIFEFGQFHNITINNTMDQKMELGRSIEGVLAYLLNPPIFKITFPFIEKTLPDVRNGNVIYLEPIIGIVWIAYFWIFFYSKKIINVSKSKKLKVISLILLVFTLIILSINTCLAGMNQRYLQDVQPFLSVLACIMWFIYLNNSKKEEGYNKNEFFEFIMKLSVLITFLFALGQIEYNKVSGFSDDYRKIGTVQYNIEKMIYFYK